MEGEDKSTYATLFLEMLDVILTKITDRFSDTPTLKFCDLPDQRNSEDLKLNSLVV
jgi:hypothetical protein